MIFIFDKKDYEVEVDFILEELRLWIGNHIQKPRLDDSEQTIIIYDRDDLKDVNIAFE